MKLINLTPHEVKITGYGTIPPSGTTARAHTNLSQIGEIDGIPLMVSRVVGMSNVPEEENGVLYIVPSFIRELLPERRDLASPAKLLRDDGGKIIGCGALEVNK